MVSGIHQGIRVFYMSGTEQLAALPYNSQHSLIKAKLDLMKIWQ
jgi:hypothetical protein